MPILEKPGTPAHTCWHWSRAMSTLQYRCETDDAPISGVIRLSDQSPWTTLLGTMPLPVAGTIEDLNETLNTNRINSALLTGEPAACLLPLIWFRSIWTSQDTPVQIEWVVDDLESGSPQRQSAARLACLLADGVECDQPEIVRKSWGFDPRSPGIAEEAYDLLIHLIDVWDPDLRLANLGEDWSEAMKKNTRTLRCQWPTSSWYLWSRHAHTRGRRRLHASAYRNLLHYRRRCSSCW